MEFEKKRPDSADIPMNNAQVIGMDGARLAMSNGGSGLLGLFVVALLLLVPGVIYGSWILIGIGLLIGVPTAIASIRRYRRRKMWEQPN